MSGSGYFRKSAQVNDKVRSDAVNGRRCPGPARPKSATRGLRTAANCIAVRSLRQRGQVAERWNSETERFGSLDIGEQLDSR